MVKQFILLVFALSLTACANQAVYNYTPKVNSFSSPPINEIVSVGVGENMLSQGISTEREILITSQPNTIALYTIPKGSYVKIGEDDKFHYYSGALNNLFITTGIFNVPDLNVNVGLNKESNEVCIIRRMEFLFCDEVKAERKQEIVESNANFQQTLIYSGKVGTNLNLSYREFSDNRARPAFNNDVVYDLATSNEISYKGAIIEVIEATNRNITYRVISNFN